MARKTKKEHYAFTIDYGIQVSELILECEIIIPGSNTGHKFNFVWDTGATCSVITQKIVETLGLSPTGRVMGHGVNSEQEVLTYIVDIGLPNKVLIKDVHVTKSIIGNSESSVHGLIGMDIINTGDMAISNHDGKTTFTFAIPPFENRTDYVEKANRLRERR